jgi:hypothetical protein
LDTSLTQCGTFVGQAAEIVRLKAAGVRPSEIALRLGYRPGERVSDRKLLLFDQQAIDSTTPIQMASVFGEQERSILRRRFSRAGVGPSAGQESLAQGWRRPSGAI